MTPVDDAAAAGSTRSAAQPRRDPARSRAARELHPAAAAPALEHLAGLTMEVLRSAAAHVSVLTEVQTIAAAAGLSRGLPGQVPLDEALCSLAVLERDVVVIDDAASDHRVLHLPPVASGVIGAYMAAPLLSWDAHVVGALCIFDPVPRTWTRDEQRVLVQLAGFVATTLELSRSAAPAPSDEVPPRPAERSAVVTLPDADQARRLLWELSISSAGVGSFDWDLTTGRLHWDARLIEQFGYSAEDFDETIEAFNDRLHPDDLERVSRTLTASIEQGVDFESEYRIVLPGQRTRWISAKGRPLRGQSGQVERLLGATLDISGTRAGEAAVAAVHESMNAAFYALDHAWRFTYVNVHAERLLQTPRADLHGVSIWEAFPAAVGSVFEDSYRRCVATGEPVTFEAFYPAPLDGWFEVRAVPTGEGLSVYFLDITARRNAQQVAEAASRRTALIAEVTAVLAEHLDAEQAVVELARLVVPHLGDWCLVSTVSDVAHTGPDASSSDRRVGLRDVAGHHHDPERQHLVDRYAQTRLRHLHPGAYVTRAMVSAQPVVIPGDATTSIAAVLGSREATEVLAKLGPAHAVVFPLRARGRTLGLLTLFADAARGPLGGEDFATALDVAGRAGLALDNARLYRQQRDLATGLQRSLLTAPPEPDHTHVVVRYVPAAEAAQVGGDWYDAFLQPDGATVLVIGDVVGHDTQAAAAMSQVRTLVRGVGALGSAGPATLLSQVDHVMQTLAVGTTATAVVARLEQTAEHAARGVTVLRWSNAGHPPPMVIQPDGSVTELVGATTDLLLGVLPDTERQEREAVLERGATVLLYTDGLVERRGQSLEEGLVRLRAVLAELAGDDLDTNALTDAVLERMLPAKAEDDVALVVVRLYPQDEPRPPHAGPRRLPENIEDVPEVLDHP